MRLIFHSFARALLSQFKFGVLLLTLLPFVLLLLFWGGLLWLGLQPMIDWMQHYFIEHDGFRTAGNILDHLDLAELRTAIVPLIVMWLLLPLIIFSTLELTALLTMPVIRKRIAHRHYPQLERRTSASVWHRLRASLFSLTVFFVLWLITLLFSSMTYVSFGLQSMLWGWLVYRIMAYEALIGHADKDEYEHVRYMHRWRLLGIGAVVGVVGNAPTLLWLVDSKWLTAAFPFLAVASIWMCVVILVFSGLWFQNYCLAALSSYRENVVPATLELQQ